AAFTGVALAANSVHRNGEVFVGFGADRPVAHRTRGKAFDDFNSRLDFIESDGCALRLELKERAQGNWATRLFVHQARVIVVGFLVVQADSMLHPGDDAWAPKMSLALRAEVVVSADRQVRLFCDGSGVCHLVTQTTLLSNDVKVDTFNATGCPGEVSIDDFFRKA